MENRVIGLEELMEVDNGVDSSEERIVKLVMMLEN